MELECIDRIYLNAFRAQAHQEKGIAGYFREFMGHRFASTKSAGKSEATGQAPGSSQHGRCQRISDRSGRAPERRRRKTQNQAFNALLFFYRHVLRCEFGKIDGVVRAKRRPYVPVVLSRAEVEVVLERLPAPYRLVGALLYGCGLRLSGCLELRIHCFKRLRPV